MWYIIYLIGEKNAIKMPTDVQFKDELSATSMIFKTFDSDIDNMSSRWGMF